MIPQQFLLLSRKREPHYSSMVKLILLQAQVADYMKSMILCGIMEGLDPEK
jgi:hypothetical protein